MPENIHKRLHASVALLGLTGFWLALPPANAADIINHSGTTLTLGISATGKNFKSLTIGDGLKLHVSGQLVAHYRNYNIKMGTNQQLILLKDGAFRLQTPSGSQPQQPQQPQPQPKPQPQKKEDGVSI